MKCFVLGTRPEWIHLKAYIDREKIDDKDSIIVNTGQHKDYSMARQYLEELRLPKPTVNLDSSPIQLHSVLGQMAKVFDEYQVGEVFVIGDTDSALAGGLAAYRSRLPLIHIEAGLRCDEPIPEEFNRRCLDTLGTRLLAPERYAIENLKREHALGEIVASPNYKVVLFRKLVKELKNQESKSAEPYGLLTLHRQENVDNKSRLREILEYLSLQRERIVWLSHPRTVQKLRQFSLRVPDRVEIREPLPYLQMIRTVMGAKSVLTDSGGLVLEAFELNKPMVIFRKSIEWKHVLHSKRTKVFQR